MSRSSKRERGTAALEFVGAFPCLLLAGMIALQFGLVGWATVSTNDAAKAAARAASLGRNPTTAAKEALPGSLAPLSVTGSKLSGGYSYTVEVKVPSVLPMIDFGSIRRTVDMPTAP
ncbi:TadE/TadG family type IV pilus assembly protein [Propioniciclava flava]|uniref:TadE-like domain-containing protein n=1 Tax=Propioniciclava flava TaxID=2072026 RepID=A0A4V1Q7B5_9ACTN|nr:TadE/TadG family type IV pilus assembly protein [Propioniciclava flava]RXW32008.1 hypothetical protein C1706_08150 [Propioniciclava flava]